MSHHCDLNSFSGSVSDITLCLLFLYLSFCESEAGRAVHDTRLSADDLGICHAEVMDAGEALL